MFKIRYQVAALFFTIAVVQLSFAQSDFTCLQSKQRLSLSKLILDEVDSLEHDLKIIYKSQQEKNSFYTSVGESILNFGKDKSHSVNEFKFKNIYVHLDSICSNNTVKVQIAGEFNNPSGESFEALIFVGIEYEVINESSVNILNYLFFDEESYFLDDKPSLSENQNINTLQNEPSIIKNQNGYQSSLQQLEYQENIIDELAKNLVNFTNMDFGIALLEGEKDAWVSFWSKTITQRCEENYSNFALPAIDKKQKNYTVTIWVPQNFRNNKNDINKIRHQMIQILCSYEKSKPKD